MLNSLEVKHKISQMMDILRNKHSSIESSYCILRLLLFKRLSDLSFRNEQPMSVPKELHWSVIKHEQHDIAQKLNEVLKLIENNKSSLEGLFTGLEINFWDRFDDWTLQNVIKIFSELDLSGESSDDLIQLGEVVEWFIETSTSIGDVYTPQQLAAMIVKLIAPQQETSIYDPVCGFGEFLVESVKFIKKQGGNLSKLRIYGQDENFQKCTISKTNLILHGIYNSNICLGSAILTPCFIQNNKQQLFDIVLTNPPFSRKYAQRDLDTVPYPNRFSYGIPFNRIGDSLFIQHVLSSLKKTGRAAMILSRGVLSRKGEEKIRRKITEDDWIEAVIELAPKLFYNTSISVAIAIFNQSKPNKRKTLFIDASHEYKGEKGRDTLQPEHVDRILSAYRNFQDEEGFSRLVSIEEIAQNNYDLSVNRYVLPIASETVDVALEVAKIRSLEAHRSELEEKIDHYLQALGIQL